MVLLVRRERQDAIESAAADPVSPSLFELASRIATDTRWRCIPGAELVVREGPRPLLGVVGRFDGSALASLELLSVQLRRRSPVRTSYDRVERDCQHLAQKLVERFGRAAIDEFAFVGLPRGGLIVVGLLAYALRLQRSQLGAVASPNTTLVVIDDCALTGSRFGQHLAQSPNRKVVFATLYAPPELRRAILAREARVIDCFSVNDLTDRSPSIHGIEHPAWRTRVLQRLDQPRYWVGEVDPIGFPWSDPDVGRWDSHADRVERGWSMPTDRPSLRQRSEPDGRPIPIQVHGEGVGPIRVAPTLISARYGRELVIADADSSECWTLNSMAADVWDALLEYGSSHAAAERLAREYDAPAGVLAAQVDEITQQLLERGLLEYDAC